MMNRQLLSALIVGAVHATVVAQTNNDTEQVLILKNERTIIGKIERVGARYRVQRTQGSIWIPAERGLHVAGNREQAYEFLRKRGKLSDPDHRLRLARWCHLNELPKQALHEVREALRVRPGHGESQRLLALFERAERRTEEPRTASTAPAPKVDKPKPELAAIPSLALSPESMADFTTHVQPLLMNACSRCHSVGAAKSAFQLKRITYGNLVNRQATQQNLLAVLAQIDGREPQKSSLLRNAARPHGTARLAPLSGAKQIAYRTLEHWVTSTLERNPRLKQELVAASPPPAPVALPPSTGIQQVATKPTFPKRELIKPRPDVPATLQPRPVPTNATPDKPAPPKDEFDPAIFNRKMHPDQPPKPSPPPRGS